MPIRFATVEDIPAIHDCHDRAILEKAAGHYSSEIIQDWLFGENNQKVIENDENNMRQGWLYLVYEEDGEIYGVASAKPEDNILDGISAKKCSFAKVGENLLREISKQCRALGAFHLDFSASLNAVAFYERMGAENLGAAIHVSRSGMEMPCIKMRLVL